MKRRKVYVRSANSGELLRKTDAAKRSTYIYRFYGMETADGATRRYIEEIELVPGEDGVTPEDIKRLHAADDHEVYVNIKARRPRRTAEEKRRVAEWKKDYIRGFKAEHGYAPSRAGVDYLADEAFPKNWVASLDGILDGDDDDAFGDKSPVLADAYRASRAEPGLMEAMDEIASAWPASWREIYERVLKNGETIVSIARERGVTEGAVRKTLNKIRAELGGNAGLRKFVRFFDRGVRI